MESNEKKRKFTVVIQSLLEVELNENVESEEQINYADQVAQCFVDTKKSLGGLIKNETLKLCQKQKVIPESINVSETTIREIW